MKKVTLYNHIKIGTDEQPLIPNLQFKKLCDLLQMGYIKPCNFYCKKYTLIPFQISLIEQIINHQNKENERNKTKAV